MDGLSDARRRYENLRASLNAHCEVDRELYQELTRAIRALDQKIAGTFLYDVQPKPTCAPPIRQKKTAG